MKVTRRLGSLVLVMMLFAAALFPAHAAADQQTDYEGAQQALNGYVNGDMSYSASEIVGWFGECDGYGMSAQFLLYAQCLQEIENGDFSMIAYRLGTLRRNQRFCSYLEANGFHTLDDLQTYALGRQAELLGEVEAAIGYYSETPICDSGLRYMQMQDELHEARYLQAMALLNSGTQAGAQEAYEIFSELAEVMYRDSQAMRDRALAECERRRGVSATAEGSGSTRTISVQADGSWTARADRSWITLSRTSGSGDATIVALLAENTTSSARTGNVIFTCGQASFRLTISQEKTDTLTVTQSGSGNSRTIAIQANGRWTITENIPWLTLNLTSGSGNTNVIATLNANTTGGTRTGWLTVTCGSRMEMLTISQQPTQSISVSQSGTGDSRTLSVSATGSWTASENVSWISLSRTRGNGAATINVILSPNTTGSSREGTIVFTCGNAQTSVTITQARGETLEASLSGTGDSRTISVVASGSWTASENVSWISLSRTRGSGNATIDVLLSPNSGSSARYGVVTITSGSMVQQVMITQESAAYLDVAVSGSGNARTLTIQTGGSWRATESLSWIALSQTSGSGNASVSVSLASNNGSSSRSGTITVTGGGLTRQVTIVQEPAAYLEATVSGSGNTRTITVRANGSWRATENLSWLTLSRTSGSGDASISVSLATNPGSSRRSGVVTFTSGGLTRQVTISQEAAPSLEVMVSGSGNTRTLTIRTSGSWTATENLSWLTLSRTSGSGNSAVTVTLASNASSQERTGWITVTSGTVSRQVSVVQAAGYSVGGQAQVGSIVTFGRYEQDGRSSNGKEPIEWIVLDRSGSDLLLLSRYALDARPYLESSASDQVTWSASSLRMWMNSTFYQNAFNTQERQAIRLTTVNTPWMPQYDCNPGPATQDRVFALSYQECERYLSDWTVYPTQYAISRGVLVRPDNGGATYWWLRSPNIYGKVSVMNSYGHLYGSRTNDWDGGVRPAIWVNAGSVSTR